MTAELPKTERLEIRVDTLLLHNIDIWRRNQYSIITDKIPSRAAAVRYLLQKALGQNTVGNYGGK